MFRMSLGLCLSLGLLLAACRQADAPGSQFTQATQLIDYTTTAELLPQSWPGPARIVSAAPNVTEICAALGLADRLVGRTRYCKHPPQIMAVPHIGALTDLNLEVLVGLQPDLILMSGTSRAQAEQFERLELNFAAIPDSTLDELYLALEQVGDLTQTQSQARKLAAAIRSDLQKVVAQHVPSQPRRVLMLISTLSTPPAPPFVCGPGSYYADLITMLGHENVVATGKAFAQLSLEAIVELDPEIILELDADGSARIGGDAAAVRAWRQIGPLKAVENERVHVLTGGQHYLLGPRIAMTAEAMAKAIEQP